MPQADANNNIPTSTANMRFNNFYNAVNVIALTATSSVNLNLLTFFGSSWADGVPKQLIIPNGVIIGSNSTSTASLILPAGMGGTLEIINSGSIQGAGGSANGGTGGTAILVQSSGITIDNTSGTIYAGGGGGGLGGTGGTGGTGGQGTYTYYSSSLGLSNCSGGCYPDTMCKNPYGNGTTCIGSCVRDSCDSGSYKCSDCRRILTGYSSGGSGGAGGSGGSGGVGQGYNQSNASGASGSGGSAGSAGGTNAGNGGTGGTGGAGGSGGTFGQSGSNGATGSTGGTGANGNYTSGSAGSAGSGGSSGGLAGYYVSGIGNVTFSATGTVAGRTV